jgi:hypothetical protein
MEDFFHLRDTFTLCQNKRVRARKSGRNWKRSLRHSLLNRNDASASPVRPLWRRRDARKRTASVPALAEKRQKDLLACRARLTEKRQKRKGTENSEHRQRGGNVLYDLSVGATTKSSVNAKKSRVTCYNEISQEEDNMGVKKLEATADWRSSPMHYIVSCEERENEIGKKNRAARFCARGL